MDYQKYCDLESYLFETVSERFRLDNSLSVFDFFCIVIWKANRAKSKIAKRLLQHEGVTNLEDAVRKLISEIANQTSSQARMKVLMKGWGFLLPMSSAILTVLYPKEFTVYDYRVCEKIEFGYNLSNLAFEKLWPEYEMFKQRVEEKAPSGLSLRDKDRFLSGKSFHDQLKADIDRSFGVQ